MATASRRVAPRVVHLTFSCLGDVPTWLNEGLAVYSEGGLDPASARQLEEAIQEAKEKAGR